MPSQKPPPKKPCSNCDGSGWVTDVDGKGKPVRKPCPRHTG